MRIPSPLASITFACLAAACAASSAQTVTIYGRLAVTTNQIQTGSSTRLTELRARQDELENALDLTKNQAPVTLDSEPDNPSLAETNDTPPDDE